LLTQWQSSGATIWLPIQPPTPNFYLYGRKTFKWQ
jgi:hypothetical protein